MSVSNDVRVDLSSLVEAAALTTKKRNKLSKEVFALPKQRKYPIHDRAHAANALSRASGKTEYDQVRRAVCKRYPDLPACKKGKN